MAIKDLTLLMALMVTGSWVTTTEVLRAKPLVRSLVATETNLEEPELAGYACNTGREETSNTGQKLTFTGAPIVPAEAEPQLAASQTKAAAGEDFMACSIVRDPANNFVSAVLPWCEVDEQPNGTTLCYRGAGTAASTSK